MRRWRRARRERARSWRCSSCTRWPPAPRGQVRTGAGRGGSGLEGSIRAARGGGRFSGAHWGAPCGVGWRDVPQGLRGALAGSPPLGWAPGRLRERQAWGGGAAARAPAAGHVRGGRGRGRGNGGALGLSEHGRAGLSSTVPWGSPGAKAGDAPAHRVLADLFNRGSPVLSAALGCFLLRKNEFIPRSRFSGFHG